MKTWEYLLRVFLDGIKDWSFLFVRPEQVKDHPVNATTTPPTIPAPQKEEKPEPYKWDTPENARHSTRVICDEEGLKLQEKNLICAVIMAESGFKNSAKCINKRKDGTVSSTDWGIGQINDHWHIGPGKSFPSVDYVLHNPDAVVRWMIKMYRGGSLKLWVAYQNGSYKRYLP